jgi:hypothetical protein
LTENPGRDVLRKNASDPPEFIAARVLEAGGAFLKGQGLENETRPARSYRKIAMGFPGVDCILGGKAFRAFAGMRFADMRDFIKNLPRKEWNYLP